MAAKHTKNPADMADLERIKATVRANQLAGRQPYEGLESSEIGKHSRACMFGDNDEAFPDRAEWSRIVD